MAHDDTRGQLTTPDDRAGGSSESFLNWDKFLDYEYFRIKFRLLGYFNKNCLSR